MGLFDFLSNKPTSGKIQRASKRMLNEHHQQQVRQEALHELAGYGTPEAIEALVKRLSVSFRDTIKNEQEIRWVSDTLVQQFGPQAVEPLIAAIKSEQFISSSIMALGRLISEEKLVGLLVETLSGYEPQDHRTIEPRMQLVDALSDHDDERVLPAMLPYAMDHDDQVRVKAIGLLEHRVDAQHALYPQVVEQLVTVIEDPEASGRITRTAADALLRLKADVAAFAERLDGILGDGYSLTADGRLAAS
jgi:HEAT repeat protein